MQIDWERTVRHARLAGGLDADISVERSGTHDVVNVNGQTVCRVPTGMQASDVVTALERALQEESQAEEQAAAAAAEADTTTLPEDHVKVRSWLASVTTTLTTIGERAKKDGAVAQCEVVGDERTTRSVRYRDTVGRWEDVLLIPPYVPSSVVEEQLALLGPQGEGSHTEPSTADVSGA